MCIDEAFVTLLSDGTEVELVPGGRNMRITPENINEYIRLVVSTRINESNRQVQAIIEGVNYVIPMEICRMMKWK